MMRLLQSSWLTALIGCLLYLAVTALLLQPSRFQFVRPSLESSAAGQMNNEASWRFRNPEFDQWVTEIKRQRAALAQREQQLQELQTRLDAERHELNTVTQIVSQLQAEFDRNVIRIKEQEVENLKRQAKVIAAMSPEGAAGLLGEMSDPDAVRILYTMKPDEASAILETYSKLGQSEAKRAATLTELMRQTLSPEPRASPTP